MVKKPVIAIVSILKPVDDTRNYEKIAYSLGKTGKYDIYIFGHYVSNLTTNHDNIFFKPIFHFHRLSFKRILAPWKIYINLLKVKPDLIIVNTHELLLVTVLNKILFGSKLLYDIQENYYWNILKTNAFPKIFKPLIAEYVRLKEKLTSRYIDHFLLAERCYEQELSFIGSKYNVLENKFLHDKKIDELHKKKSESISFVYSGTIAEEYGIFDAIEFAEQLKKHIDLSFTIIGYCPQSSTFKKIRNIIRKRDYIKILGGDELIAHNQILKVINHSDYAMLPYRTDTYYSRRIPTRIYECLALSTPMIIRPNPHWTPIFNQIDAFLFSDFATIDQDLLDQLKQKEFFRLKNEVEPFWHFDSEKLIKIVNDLMIKS